MGRLWIEYRGTLVLVLVLVLVLSVGDDSTTRRVYVVGVGWGEWGERGYPC